jgi:hypothetical protein
MSDDIKELQRVCKNISKSTKELDNNLIDFLVVFKKLVESGEIDAEKIMMESEEKFLRG